MKKGLTIVEILIAITIFAIILAIAFPSFARYRADLTLKSFCDDFSQVLKYAKESARSYQGVKIEFKRVPEDEKKKEYPLRYIYAKVKKTDGKLIKYVQIPSNIYISGIPMCNYFDLKPDGTPYENIQMTIQNSRTLLKGKIYIDKETGAVTLTYEK